MVKDYQYPRFLAIHRIDTALLLEADASKPASVDIDEFILREFGIRLGNKLLNMILRIRGVLAKYLAETPVGPDQSMMAIDDEWSRIRV